MSIPLVVVGAGGFGREALDVVEAMNKAEAVPVFQILGVLDADPSIRNLERLAARGVAYLGTDSAWREAGIQAQYLVGIGDPQARQRVAEAFSRDGFEAATAIHPAASIGSRVTIGGGSVVCGGAQLSTNVSLGQHVQINPNATIGHDAVLHDFVSINPAATISGEVIVEARALIGAAAVILQGIAVGEDSLVGASACVVRRVKPKSVVKGVPAR
ncbi:acetyltransferase [Cryobacterium sp. TmT2-59]|uniref:acetyltransferase n=1 Tax=Cryobacterium sp. TmT2-59 TaxID=1259264 RepID=UPI00106B7865|nr:acetyltransferase [Cryobacterium sp. TmT2-59]TFC89815.1 acetyltransferase [Cryobacterium sp. TmT2-59]